MSTLLEQASLIMIPSGYKEDVVYSVIPENGSGDLSFTRASNGTRVNSAGLVEVCPWNLADQSNGFSTSPWVRDTGSGGSLPTLTPNYGTAPDGTQNAWRIQLSRANNSTSYSQVYQYPITVISGQQYTWSVYLKSLSGTPTISIIGDFGRPPVTLTNEWVRYTGTGTASSGLTQLEIAILGSNFSAGNSLSADILAYGYQFNIGSTAKPYFPTTDRLNVPRLTYQNGGGGCPSLLLEKQSTNLALYSEQFDNASGWSAINGSGGSAPVITANYGISPDGTQNADRIQLQRTTGAGSYAVVYQPVGISVAQNYTYSVWLKSLSGTPTIQIGAGQVTLTNQWVRYTQTASHPIGTVYPQLAINTDDAGTSLTADFLAWGYQIEQSSYVTSYIPTTSASATRVADACFKTGISSLIGQTEGAVFLDFIPQGGNITQEVFGVTVAGGGIEYIAMYAQTNGNLYFTTNIFTTTLISANAFGQRFKVGYSYKAGTHLLYVNGSQIATSSTSSVYSTLNALYINQSATGSGVEKLTTNEMVLSKTAFTATELASLTTI
jgi:hypothetical protein